MTFRAAIYCRISEDREGRALGVKRQEADCRKLCADRSWAVAHVYVDNDLSAYSGKPRPGYSAMMAALQSGDVDAIVAYNADRLHRSPVELENFIDVIEAQHATVATCSGGDYDLSTADGRLTARMLGGVARHQSEKASERQLRKMVEVAQSGRPHGGPRPYGFDADKITVNDHEAEVIREVTSALIDGASMRSQCLRLNARGDLGANGKDWQESRMHRMLLSARLIGKREHRVTGVHDAVWPAIITELQQIQLRTILSRPRRRGAPGKYLLSGILRCGVCGTRMNHWVGSGRNKPAYICPAPPRGHQCVSVNASKADELVTDAILECTDAEPMVFTENDDGGGELAAAIAADTQLLDDLGKLFGTIPQATYQSSANMVEARIREHERALAALTPVQHPAAIVRGGNVDFVTGKPFTLRHIWDDCDVDERRWNIEQVVERIEVHRARRGASVSERLHIIWRS